DEDGTGDACDGDTGGGGGDTDGDGFSDSVDNCPLVYNPNQADTYGETYGDACEHIMPKEYSLLNDNDKDGVVNGEDNCVNHYNPGQEDGFGSPAGDVCDTVWFNPGIGIKGYPLLTGYWEMWANCVGDMCYPIARFDPSQLKPNTATRFDLPESAGWYVVVLYLGKTSTGLDVYQVNTYNPVDTLIDDRLEIYVNAAGEWRFRDGGGQPRNNPEMEAF
ncbi:MAG: thrombospondin type 3 repeat-containing protein, partial [Anaerolineae bacterium]|nr:thrombospondin type 3 repeat-containing protein [Anaerolineae bacterium]